MAQTKPKAGQFYGVSNNGTDGEFLQTDGTGGMAWASPITNPTITSIDYPGSATAADPAGGESVIINGTLFASGITCTVGGTSAVTAFNSATQITITTPAKAAGPYTVAVTNTNGGTASQANFIQYSGVPVWSTAAGTLGNVMEGGAASFQVTATEGSDTIEYAVTTGTLPTGLSLATATGAITGTAPAVSADTTTTFSITATDDENQTSASRSFSITVQNDAPSNHFNTVLYTGNDVSHAITGVGFEPGLVWIKRRNTSEDHALYDIVRGINKQLSSNSTAAEATNTSPYEGFTSFDTDGFTVNNNGATNRAPNTYVAWNFKAGGTAVANTDGTINSQVSVNNTLGFSVVKSTYTSTASYTVGHGLSERPQIVFNKNLDQSDASYGQWWTWIEGVTGTNGDYIRLNVNNGKSAFSDTFTTDTTIKYSTAFQVTGTNKSIISYAFHSKPGFSKVGSYTGTGVVGNTVMTVFEPAFVIIKKSSGTGEWYVFDNKRLTGSYSDQLAANSNAAETTGTYVKFLANGFQLNTAASDLNTSSQTFIYLAFAADGSTATPSLANSFATEIYTGNSGTQSITTGFKPDFSWIKARNIAYNHALVDSVRGRNSTLISDLTNAANPNSGVDKDLISFDTNGITVGPVNQAYINPSYNMVSWNWKAGGTPSINTDGTITSVVSANQAAGFSIVKFTSPFNGQTAGHGLSSTPEMIILKVVNASATWYVWTPALTSGNSLALNDSRAQNTDLAFTVNSTTFTTNFTNTSYEYIAYCFTSISGYSKVGSYTSNNTSLTINVGFTPGLVLIKNIDTSGQDLGIYLTLKELMEALFGLTLIEPMLITLVYFN